VRIGIDVTCWQNARGFGRFTRELVRQLVEDHGARHEFVLVADRFTAGAAPFPPGVRVVVAGTREPSQRATGGWRNPVDLLRLGWQAARCGADVFWFPAVAAFYPVLGRVPVVVAFHDAMTEERPELFFPTWRARRFWQIKMWMAGRQASALVAPSASARQRVAAALDWPLDRITSIGEAPAAVFGPTTDAAAIRAVRSRYGLPLETPLVLYVGGLEPHKNVGTLVAAMPEVSPGDPAGWHLVLAGEHRLDDPLGDPRQIVRLCRELGLAARVTLTGFVPDEDLALLYNAASVLVQPSLDEGFGLPVVEAMACGLPVAVSARGSLPEVVGDAGLTFDPHDRPAIARAVARLLGDAALRRELGARGLARAASFTWTESARRMIAVLEAAAAR
jgi:glycosyltransferase involved in cell wall biosynthesis